MKFIDTLSEQGVHETRLRAIFGKNVSFSGHHPEFDKPLVVVAFQNRSGSNLLVNYLRQTGQFNCYFEKLNYDAVEHHCSANALDSFPAYIKFLQRDMGKPHLSDCIKASWDQLLMLLRFGIDRMYPNVRVLHMQRQDVVAQAVSHSIALQTKQWASYQKRDPDSVVHFDPKTINRCVEAAVAANALVPVICATADLQYHGVDYGDLCSRPSGTMEDCAKFLGTDFSGVRFRDTDLKKQSGVLNTEHIRRYLDILRLNAKIDER